MRRHKRETRDMMRQEMSRGKTSKDMGQKTRKKRLDENRHNERKEMIRDYRTRNVK